MNLFRTSLECPFNFIKQTTMRRYEHELLFYFRSLLPHLLRIPAEILWRPFFSLVPIWTNSGEIRRKINDKETQSSADGNGGEKGVVEGCKGSNVNFIDIVSTVSWHGKVLEGLG